MFVCRFHLFAYVALLCLKATLIPCANAKLAEDPSQRPEVVSSSTLTGQVVDTDGKGVQNADVYLLRSPNGAYTLPVRPLSSKTASDGGFIFDQLPEGSYQIWAETTEATSLVKKLRGRKVKIVAALPEQENAEVEKAVNENELLKIPLHPGCGFDVSVHDSNGQPVVGADISFGWTDIDRHYATQANGVARIRGLAEDEWYLVVRAPGMAIDWLKTSKQNLGSVLPLDFTLSSGGSLKLKLVDETGSPVQDAEVYVSLASRSTTPNLTKPKLAPTLKALCSANLCRSTSR